MPSGLKLRLALAVLLLLCTWIGGATGAEGALSDELNPAWLCRPHHFEKPDKPTHSPSLAPHPPSLTGKRLRPSSTPGFFLASEGELTALRIPTRSTLKPYLGAAMALPSTGEQPSVSFLSESDSPRLALGFDCLVAEGVRFGLDLRFLNDTFRSLVSPFADERDPTNGTSIRFGYEVSF